MAVIIHDCQFPDHAAIQEDSTCYPVNIWEAAESLHKHGYTIVKEENE